MTGFVLKLLALASMLADHVGAVFFPEVVAFRVVGRISMPIFCYLAAEGCRHTHDWKKYMGRLLLFGLVSEVPFDLCFYGTVFYPLHQNMMFTLAFGVLAVALYERHRLQAGSVWAIGVALAATLLQVDYSAYGVLLVFAFYLWGTQPQRTLLCLGALTLLMFPLGPQTVAVAAIVPLSLYNGERGRDMRWLFYGFYPGHLLALWLAQRWLF